MSLTLQNNNSCEKLFSYDFYFFNSSLVFLNITLHQMPMLPLINIAVNHVFIATHPTVFIIGPIY